jgi:HK97 family phage major capsid protein
MEQIRARLAAIAARLEEIQAGETGYSEEQQTEINGLNDEFETLNGQLATAEKVEAMKEKAKASAGRKVAPAAGTEARVEVAAPRNHRFGGFNSPGEWLMAVKTAGQTGEIHKTLKAAVATEKVGEDGGFLVPEEISDAILKKLDTADDSLMARSNFIQVSGNSLTLNIDESQPWNQGIQCYWTAEGTSITESKPVFKQAAWRLQKIAALVKATDELLDDATALGSYIQKAAPDAFMHKINSAILSGNGAGKPQGIINSAFAVTVDKESMQTADTINANNVVKMYGRMFPSSLANSVWLVNPACLDQLRLLQDSNGNYIYLAPGGFGNQIANSPYATLLGRPVIPMMGSIPALGDLGDIQLVDMSYYWGIRKAAGIKSATSIHLLFDKEQTAFRFSMRLDGKCPFQSPVTTEFGSFQMSAFVLLQAR